nr:MAG TPA: hypothetical protein [Caudoviricetes sp.]
MQCFAVFHDAPRSGGNVSVSSCSHGSMIPNCVLFVK